MRVALTVLAVWCAGLGAAAQFGKMSVLYDTLLVRYAGHSPVEIGLIVSIVGIVGLIFGTTAGLMVARLGVRRVMVSALAVGALMSVLQALDLSYPLIILSRVAEGFSHLAIVVVGPTVMAAVASDRFRGMVMTLWSSFFGVAYSLLALFGPWEAQSLFFGHALWMAVLTGVLWGLLPADQAAPPNRSGGNILRQHLEIYRSPRMSAPALGFFCYTFLYVAMLTLLPPEMPGGYRTAAATAMPFFSIAVSLTIGVWLLSRVSPVRLVQFGYALAIPPMILLWLGSGQGGVMMAAGLWLSSALGLVQGASFASIPALNATPEARARAAGAIAQLGNLGTTSGTPVLAAVILSAGPTGLGLIGCAACLVGISLHAIQERRRQILST